MAISERDREIPPQQKETKAQRIQRHARGDIRPDEVETEKAYRFGALLNHQMSGLGGSTFGILNLLGDGFARDLEVLEGISNESIAMGMQRRAQQTIEAQEEKQNSTSGNGTPRRRFLFWKK
ncbi:MAG: hypothetical protein M1524_01580 [Patescibacteria group bacterium]|nr:hypothetical protein [Patescibacteria group bacterium]